jgi:probable rRNA maturation factor
MRARHVRDRSRGLRVVITDARGRAQRAGGLARWLEHAAPRNARGVVSVALVSDTAIRRLNNAHRHQDVATDVLSFPVGPGGGGPGPERLLGDLAIATGVARRQARAHGHSLDTELRVLALHGLLHLLGYDHEADDGRMARAEARLGRRAGLPVALIARAPRGVLHS